MTLSATGRATATLALASAILVLGGCGSDGQPPSVDPTRTGLPTPTRTLPALPSPTRTAPERPTASPTATEEPTEKPTVAPSETPTEEPTEAPSETPTAEPTEAPSETPTEAPTPTETVTESVTASPTEVPTSASPTAEESATEGEADEDAEEDGIPAWVWWLLAALVIGSAIAIPLIVRSRRRSAWRAELDEATTEMGWFARDLLPQLQSVGSPDQVAGGWTVAAVRVTTLEDRLTQLEATAPTEADQARALTLRDAVRQARESIERLVAPGATGPAPGELQTIASGLEAAMVPPVQ